MFLRQRRAKHEGRGGGGRLALCRHGDHSSCLMRAELEYERGVNAVQLGLC